MIIKYTILLYRIQNNINEKGGVDLIKTQNILWSLLQCRMLTQIALHQTIS